MKNLTYVLIFMSLCMYTNSIEATEIENFESGLVCDAKGEKWLCHNTVDIYITGQGSCVYNKKDYPCTWYGFSFSYKNNKPGTKLECKYSQTHLGNSGNPNEEISKNTDSGSYEIVLDKSEGYFFNPQYTILTIAEKSNQTESIVTNCSINGELVANFSFILHIPTI